MVQIDEKTLAAFHQLWDGFPTCVRMIHRSHEVLAVNDTAAGLGFKVGEHCNEDGNPQRHAGCKAMLALKTQQAQVQNTPVGRVKFWLPVEGYPEVYIHFSVASAELPVE